MKKIILIACSFCLLLSFSSCLTDSIKQNFTAMGHKPIYAAQADLQNITSLPAQAIQRLGKMYYKDEVLYVNELYKGVHVIDNSNPSNPTFLKFIQIPGNKDIAIKGTTLYADNGADLVALNISDLDNITVLKRVPNLYPAISQSFPEGANGYFECVDFSLGAVIGWEYVELQSPQCQR